MKHLLTNSQNSIWLTEQYYTNTSVNNVCGYVYISDVVNFEVLKDAINLLVKTNDGMRLKFTEENNSCVQYVDEYKKFEIEMLELSSEKDIEIQASEIASIPFEIKNNFLFKFTLFKLPNGSGGYIYNSHHIIGDSWTLGLVAKESTEIYSKLLSNEYVLENYPSYLNYIEYENNYKNSDKFNKDKAFWDEIYKTVPEIASIPYTKNISSNSITCKGTRKKFIIPKKELMQIKDFCAKNQISIYNFFMASYCLYIGRVCNLDDFVIGTPILNRTNYEQKNTMGMFVSTVPLRINLNHNLPFIDFTKKIATDTMAILRHQRYPYQFILEELRKKDSSVPNLYNIVLSYQITKTIEENSNIKYSTDWIFNGCSADDFQIHIFDLNDESAITIAYDYKTDKYDSQDIKDLHSRILTIINQIINNQSILLKDIEIVTPEEKHKILYEFNNTQVDYPRDNTIVDLFEEQVKKTPDNIAVVFEDQKLTYKELNEKANQLAMYLLENNVSSGDVVGVCLKRSTKLIIAIFAILKCGAVYMPMHHGYPMDRLSYMLTNSHSKLVIVSNDTASLINFNMVINIDAFSQSLKTLYKPIAISEDDLAYIIYTSGSTGKPKGVKICHKNLGNFIFSFNKYYKNNITFKDAFLASTNLSFDVSIWEIFMPLLNGAQLIFNTEEIISDISLYCDNIIKNNITALYIPPNILDEVYTILNRRNYHSISKLLVGVESITNTTLNKYIDLNPDIIIVNGYGPTEATICATAFIYKKDTSSSHIIPIGKPLYNNKVYILSNKKLCPINVPGELYISGNGVGKGYVNDFEKTNASFMQDIFFNEKIMYYTGDLAYYGTDGNIHFVGRKDNQVKFHGYRIELNEIDSAVCTYPPISKSLSILQDNCIISYYISNEEILSSDIKSFLRTKLPFYMIPSFYIKLESFPLTINGKIDRKNLPHQKISINKKYIPPSTDIERLLCNIWCSLFNKEKISITDNFFELGGDSLTAIKLQTEALKYNININYGDIFANPNIQQLAKQTHNKNTFSIDKEYNYDKLNKLLSINSKQYIHNIVQKENPKFVLLLGATGFLGSHILDNLLSNTNATIYCLVRDKGSISNKERLMKTLDFYFGTKYSSYFDKRIFVINGDITIDNLGLDSNTFRKLNNNISCVINSAALVKHYGNFDEFNKINIEGTKNIIKFCMSANIKLYHISTISVSGIGKTKNSDNRIYFKENNLYLNQNLNNAYIYTKFQSEVLILESMYKGLKATILRLGNISNRYKDGKFQINFADNAYLNRLKSFIAIGMIPVSLMNHAIDFSPVDYCADAIVKIICSKNEFTVLHIFNNNLITFADIIGFINQLNYNIDFASDTLFKRKITTLLETQNKKESLSGIIPDLDSDKNLNLIFDVVPNADFSNKFLNKINFNWPKIDFEYINLLIKYFKNIGYIE